MSDRSGETIRDYKLIRKVGEGEFASVYEALHITLEVIRAIKIIHARHMVQHGSMERFKSEAQMIARLNHPHIVRLYEFWIDDDGAYIAMEWMAGSSLESRLAQKSQFSPIEVNEILQKIAPALSAVHRQQIVHRDLKPANIMFDGEQNPYVADFGLAKWHVQPTHISTSNAAIGTPAYMPPEQVESGDSNITGAADIYSLGIIIYEMLAGKHPFDGTTGLVEMILHQLRDALPLLHDVSLEIPESIDDIVQRATQKDPSQRYNDILEFAAEFATVIDLPPVNSLTTSHLAAISGVVEPRGDVYAHVYRQSGAVLEKPRRLVGRDTMVDRVLSEIKHNERVLLHGLAGMGKTSTAATIAAKYLENAEDAAQKVIWIELGKQTADTFFDAIANVLGEQSALSNKTGDQRILAMREMLLQQQNTLLVIDNIWNEQAMIPIMRSVPHEVPVLMTSRKLLSIDGILIEIEQLDTDDALDLLQVHTGRTFKDTRSAQHLLETLGNHPYAIELAGSRLKIYRHITLEKLIQDIQSAPHDTGQLGGIKKRDITELLDESMAELSPALRDLLITMGGLYTTYASVVLLSEIVKQDEETLIENLAEIERNGLIRLYLENGNIPFYRMHDLTYSYLFMEFIKCFQRDFVYDGIYRYVYKMSTDHDAIAFNLSNILGAVRNLHRGSDHRHALDIMGKLMTDGYVDSRGYPTQIMDQMNQSIQIAMQSPDEYQTVLHYLLTKRGNAHDEFGDLDMAKADYEIALNFSPTAHRKGTILCVLGGVLFRQKQDDYNDYFEKAQQIASETQDDIVLVRVLGNQGMCALTLEQFYKAEDFFSQAIAIAQQTADAKRLFLNRYNLAITKAHLGCNQEAIEIHKGNYEAGQEVGNHTWIALSLSGMGLAYHGLNEQAQAKQCFSRALRLFEELGDALRITWIKDFMKIHYSE